MDKRSYLRHFGVVLSGTAFGQAINLISYPIIARLYLPADFGMFALFLAICSVPGVVSGWRFELTIPTVPKHGQVAAYWLCVALSLISGCLAGAATGLFWLASTPDWSPFFALLVGVAVFLTGFTAASTMFLLRQEAYRTTAAGVVTRTAVVVAGQIALAFVWRDSLGLVLGYCLGFVVQALVLGWAIGRRIKARPPRLKRLRAVFRRYRRQVAVDVPSTLVGAVSMNMMAPLLVLLFNSSAAGIYALAVRVAIVPMQLFNDALGQVFFQKAARAEEARGTFWPEFKFSLLSAGAISLAVVLMIYLLAEQFVSLYLGDRWAASGTVLIILAPMVGLNSVCMSVATSVFVLKRVHWLLFLNIATVAAQGAAFGLAYILRLELDGFLAVTAALMGSAYLIFILYLAVVVRRRDRRRPVPEGAAG